MGRVRVGAGTGLGRYGAEKVGVTVGAGAVKGWVELELEFGRVGVGIRVGKSWG